jgi:dTDP-4-dehydrorhamnose reductase
MRVVIVGSRGQLGRDLVERFSAAGEAIGFDLPELDITNRAALHQVVADAKPDCVINAAAYTQVDQAEDDEDRAYAINEAGARNVANAAAILGVPIVYYSTDYVFDGKKGTPYVPGDPIWPGGVYAKSKAAGEAATRAANPRHFIVRTAWLYGPGGDNFVEKILHFAATKPELKVVNDETGSPTHTYDLAEATAALVKTTAFGVYHAVNAGMCTRYAFAQAILELARLDTPIRPCASGEFPTKAPRPAYSVLDTSALAEASGYRFRPWREALDHYLKRREAVA